MEKDKLKQPTKVGEIMRKIRIFAQRYYTYPFPEEPFFKDVAEKAICDAHGSAEREVFTKVRIKMLWLHVKGLSLRYLTAIRDELRTRLMAHAQKAYYAQKLGTQVGTLEKKVESLVDQFSDPEDIRY